MEEPIQRNYTLPAELGAALLTNRPVLLTQLTKRLEDGESLPAEQQVDMVRLVADLITDRQVDRDKIQELEGKLSHLSGTANNLEQGFRDLRRAVKEATGA